jgi:hypothetical protein
MLVKYIRGQDDKITTFPMAHEHKATAESLHITPKSAGFFISDDGVSFGYGDSQSLEVKSLPEDTELVVKSLAMA